MTKHNTKIAIFSFYVIAIQHANTTHRSNWYLFYPYI